MRFLAIIIALGGLVLGASAVPAPQATTFPSIGSGTSIGNGTTTGHVNTFIDSCSSLRIWESKTDVYLMALCRADDGKQVSTTLDLNHCIANQFGSMVARAGGNFGLTCRGMVQHGVSYMYGYCNEGGKYDQYCAIDLAPIIENTNGQLNCFGIHDDKTVQPPL